MGNVLKNIQIQNSIAMSEILQSDMILVESHMILVESYMILLKSYLILFFFVTENHVTETLTRRSQAILYFVL